ncbi:MAG: pseudaminic acid synthase [Thermodesulfovibrionales bacterium]
MNFTIGNRRIGEDNPVFIVAELSGNHLQKFDLAVETITAAKYAGADAIKLQTYTPDTLTINAENEYFIIRHNELWSGKTLYRLYSEAYTPWDWQPKLKKVADKIGIILFSTPFDKTSVDFLEENVKVPAYKISSFEIVDIPLIEYVAKKGRPIIMSTGMASIEEINEAVEAARKAGANEIALLKCTSAYPALPEDMNLRTILHLAETFQVVVGLSDHTLDTGIPIAAVALGASIIEKHFTLSRRSGGPDASFSLEPDEFKEMVEAIRVVEKALGGVYYGSTYQEERNKVFRKSIFIVKDIKEGEVLTEEHVRSIRPGYGLHPKYLKDIIGRKAKRDIKKGTPLQWEIIE